MTDLDKLKEAGQIAAKVREHAKEIIKPGMTLLEATEILEKKIYDLGAEPAFPVTMSLNSVAAHYAADIDDDTVLEDQVIKVDVGAHVDGYIGDTAVTIDLSGEYTKLLEATEEALENAIKKAKPGAKLGEIGRAIQETLAGYGFSPIKNLSGHGVAQYDAHTSPSIPNYDTGSEKTLEKGMSIAIEPFGTDGQGLIKESDNPTIYSQASDRQIRSMMARKVLKEIKKFNGLPFNYRWLTEKFSKGQVKLAIRQLEQAGIIRGHPPLPEVADGMVAQFEHTLYIDDETEVTTRS
ncbi:MAG: type II methionyl aminopeptidase [Nanobdellota archaeon]